MAKRWTTRVLAGLLAVALTGCSSVVARVNGKDITRSQFYEELERAGGLGVLQQMIINQLILERAGAAGVMPTEQDVAARFDEFKAEQFEGDETKLRQWMHANATDDKAILDQIRLQLAIEKLRTAHLNPTDADLEAFFKEYREQAFDKPARMKFRQIVLETREQAAQVIAQLNSEEVLFQALAREKSLDQNTAAEGGLVPEAPVPVLKAQVPVLLETLEKLDVNQINQEPIEVQGRFLVVKLLEKLPAEPADYDDPEVKQQVREAFLQFNAKPEQEFLAEVARDAEVVVLADRYKSAIEPRFSGSAMPGGIPPQMQEQLSQPPEMTEPTHIDASEAPPVAGAE